MGHTYVPNDTYHDCHTDVPNDTYPGCERFSLMSPDLTWESWLVAFPALKKKPIFMFAGAIVISGITKLSACFQDEMMQGHCLGVAT